MEDQSPVRTGDITGQEINLVPEKTPSRVNVPVTGWHHDLHLDLFTAMNKIIHDA